MKNSENWIVGISNGESHEYKIGNVTFEVISEFEPPQSNTTIKNRFERTLTNNLIDLTNHITESKIGNEYVCSTAGKED